MESCWQVEDAEMAVAVFLGAQQMKGNDPVAAALQFMNDVSSIIEGFGTTHADDLDDARKAWLKSVIEHLVEFVKSAEESPAAADQAS